MHSTSDIPEIEPTEVTAGDTVKFSRDLSDHYPATLWTLKYYGFGRKGVFEISATADGSAFSITVAAEDTKAWQKGEYTFKGYVTEISTSERYEIYSGALKVNTNPAQLGSESHDDRSWARKCLDAIEGEMERRAGRSDRSYSIAGRSLAHDSMKELQDARARFKAEVRAEEQALNGSKGTRILTRFTAVT